jgi:hypothetical protein
VKLKRVEIARLRGIPGDWPAVEIGEKGLIVYGPNGVGKSSIIDALEATIKGSSSLFAHSRAGVNWDTASPHVKGGDRSCTVYGMAEGKALEVDLGESPVPELSDWINAARGASFVLRRYMLLQFVDAEPRARYEQIEPFLNLANFAELERGLKAIVVDLDTRIANAQTKVASDAQVIRQTFGLSSSDSARRANLLVLLQAKLANAGLSVTNSDILDLPKLSSLLAAELGGETTTQKVASLGAVKHQAQQLTSASVLRILYDQTLTAAHELRKELEASVQKSPLELLTKAREHIASTSESSCPVCEQVVDRAQLLARLDHRIKTDEAVGFASITLTERLADVSSAASKARTSYETFMATWDGLDLGQLPQCYAEAKQLFGQLEVLTASTVDANSDSLGAAFEKSECNPSMQIAEIDASILAVGGGDRRTLLIEAANYVSSLHKDVLTHELAQQEELVLVKQRLLAEKLHAHAEAARKNAVQQITDQVAELANEFYEIVHTDEGIATARLTVRQATTGSILLESTFYGQEAPPLKYYSESHLDTLGLCFFLAIRKLEMAISPHFKLLLIDDVLHSVDAEHRTRLAALLRDQFGDHQIVRNRHERPRRQ